MIYTGLSRTGEIVDVKAHGGGDISEVYGGIGETNPIYYKSRTITGALPLSYKALGKPLSDYLISGNTVQDGTPTPEAPVDVVGCGVRDEAHQSYKLPLTVNGIEYPIYLGQVETTRKIKKLVLDGTENWTYRSGDPANVFFMYLPTAKTGKVAMSNAYPYYSGTDFVDMNDKEFAIIRSNLAIRNSDYQYESQFKAYLAAQYAADTPITVWYVLAKPETAVVNEPLMKIGDYADTVTMAQAGVTIPTIAGSNTLSVGTTVQPSSISITGNIKSN